MKVYMVTVTYQYDGVDQCEVYSTMEKALDVADQLIFEFKSDGYEMADGYPDVDMSEYIEDDTWATLRLADESGEVEIEVVEKELR